MYRTGQARRASGGSGTQHFQTIEPESGKAVGPTHRPPYLPGDMPGTLFCCRSQGHSAAGRFMSMENPTF